MTETTDIKALRDSAECMANLLDNLAGYEPSDIDMDTVELRFEDDSGCDTGCDISIVGTAQKSADIIRALINKFEAERQQREAAEAELAELRGEQEPVAWRNETNKAITIYKSVVDNWERNGWNVTPLFTRQPKPVVVLSDCDIAAVSHMAHWYTEEQCEAWVAGVEHAKKQMQAAGIVVKGGE